MKVTRAQLVLYLGPLAGSNDLATNLSVATWTVPRLNFQARLVEGTGAAGCSLTTLLHSLKFHPYANQNQIITSLYYTSTNKKNSIFSTKVMIQHSNLNCHAKVIQ